MDFPWGVLLCHQAFPSVSLQNITGKSCDKDSAPKFNLPDYSRKTIPVQMKTWPGTQGAEWYPFLFSSFLSCLLSFFLPFLVLVYALLKMTLSIIGHTRCIGLLVWEREFQCQMQLFRIARWQFQADVVFFSCYSLLVYSHYYHFLCLLRVPLLRFSRYSLPRLSDRSNLFCRIRKTNKYIC